MNVYSLEGKETAISTFKTPEGYNIATRGDDVIVYLGRALQFTLSYGEAHCGDLSVVQNIGSTGTVTTVWFVHEGTPIGIVIGPNGMSKEDILGRAKLAYATL